MNLLIAEDNHLLQMLACDFMELWGYKFDIVSNGKEAVKSALRNEGKYDLCIMDIDMPIMDGIMATKIIRKNVKYFPIIAVSGNLSNRIKSYKAGMDHFLKKPYAPEELQEIINEFTVKSIKLYRHHKKLIMNKVIPMDEEHLKELIKLREKGLTKLCIRGTDCEIVVDERVQNKISYDLIGKKQELSEFLDRSEKKPGICHLYKANFMLNTKYLLPEELDMYIEKEEKILQKCESKTVKPFDD